MSRRSDLDKGSVTGGLVNEAYNDVKIVADNMDDVVIVANNLPFPEGYSVAPTSDVGDGTVEGDMDAMDWTGHAHAHPDIQTALEVKDNQALYIFHKNIVYSYIGKRPALIGVGGTPTIVSDYNITGSKTKALHFPDGDLSDPALGDAVARANQFLGFDANGDIIFSTSTVAVTANAVAITDAKGYYDAVQVEAALEEIVEKTLPLTGGTMIGPIKGAAGTPAEDELIRKDYAFNAIGFAAMPIGGIIMYSGALINIPLNWELCDGNNGTPNLVDKFVMGTVVEAEIGTGGGFADATLVSHNHGGGGSHTHSYDKPSLGAGNEIATGSEFRGFASTQTSAAAFTIPAEGESATGKNIPPYVKLAYIQRKS